MNPFLTLMTVALLLGGATLHPAGALAASCCGGGSAAGISVPSYARGVIDVSVDAEFYHGYWDGSGGWRPDPPGSDLRQYRATVAGGYRFSPRWQGSVSLPLVLNDNRYGGVSSRSAGLGDTTVTLLRELTEDRSAWRVYGVKDLVPAVTLGLSATLPTGISPYDDETSSFDITGRGFYRLDGTLLVEKSLRPWNISLSGSWGTHLERKVNREYGRYVAPYRKKLGERAALSASVGYTWVVGDGGDSLNGSLSWNWLSEGDARYDGQTDTGSGFDRQTIGLSLAWSGTDTPWSVRISWNHGVRRDGWGENFPATDVFSLGVRHVFE